MATWADVAKDNYAVALRLRVDQQHSDQRRSCVSRAYYAAYAAMTDYLSQLGVGFGKLATGAMRTNPRHSDLLIPIPEVRRALGARPASDLRAKLKAMYDARLEADYAPGREFSQVDVRDALRNLAAVFRILGVS